MLLRRGRPVEDLNGQAERKGAYLLDRLRAIPCPNVREMREPGLMIGIEMKHKAAPYLKALQERRVFALNAGMTVIHLMPPLVISAAQLDQVIACMEDVLLNPAFSGQGDE